jgi:hypothetical protein
MFAVNYAHTSAGQLLYTLNGDTNISFTVNTQPIPDAVFPDGFVIQNVGVILDGSGQVRDVGFVRNLIGGGLILMGTDLNFAGPQLFSGTLSSPTLLSGNFTLTGFNEPARTFSLSVAPAGAAVPEPQSWLMLLLGFGLIGGALRLSRRSGSEAGHCAVWR